MLYNAKNTNLSSNPKQDTKVIPIYREAAHLEREINQHIQTIKSLISELRPSDRQQYFNGLLNYLLSSEVTYPLVLENSSTADADISALSQDELSLIRELSTTLHRLHVEADGD